MNGIESGEGTQVGRLQTAVKTSLDIFYIRFTQTVADIFKNHSAGLVKAFPPGVDKFFP
jgi:hypothetical protein